MTLSQQTPTERLHPVSFPNTKHRSSRENRRSHVQGSLHENGIQGRGNSTVRFDSDSERTFRKNKGWGPGDRTANSGSETMYLKKWDRQLRSGEQERPPSPEPFCPREKRPRKGKWGQGPAGSVDGVGADPEPAPRKERFGMRNGEWNARTRLPPIRTLSILYIRPQAVVQEANGKRADEGTSSESFEFIELLSLLRNRPGGDRGRSVRQYGCPAVRQYTVVRNVLRDVSSQADFRPSILQRHLPNELQV